MLLPALMLCIAMLVQPVLMLYTRTVMQAAAAEGCRLVSTAPALSGVSDRTYRAYILRRLSAVPSVDVFHVGGDAGWDIEIGRENDGRTVRVGIGTAVRPLPLLGVLAAMLGTSDDQGNIVLKVEVEAVVRPAWVEGDYDAWSSIWD